MFNMDSKLIYIKFTYNSIETRKFKEHEFIVNNHCYIIE